MDQLIIKGSVSTPQARFFCKCIDIDDKIHVRCEIGKRVKIDYEKMGYDTLREVRLAISGYEVKDRVIQNYEDKNNTVLDLDELDFAERIYAIHEFQYDSKHNSGDQQLLDKLLSEFKTVAINLGIDLSDDVRIFDTKGIKNEQYKDYVKDLRRRQDEAIKSLEKFYKDYYGGLREKRRKEEERIANMPRAVNVRVIERANPERKRRRDHEILKK
ncbi:unnamed protein product [marine sediment metagenome]|uniref:Uncharacterized protein n=1 Tax=marine sediment metagenome TaxID=412755 RepID=X1C855_9ZZZZ